MTWALIAAAATLMVTGKLTHTPTLWWAGYGLILTIWVTSLLAVIR